MPRQNHHPRRGRAGTRSGAWVAALALTLAGVLLGRLLPDLVAAPGRAASSSVLFIPTAAHSTGAAGTNWRTDVELRNPYTTAATVTIAALLRNADNTSPLSHSMTVGPGKATRLTDALDSVFHISGAAALRITVDSGAILATSRTYNLMVAGNPLGLPAGSTFGQLVPAVPADEAIGSDSAARLIQLAEDAGYRTNLGFVNTTASTIQVRVDLYSADAALLGTIQGTADTTLRPYEYRQIDRVFRKVTSADVADGFAVVRTTTQGGALLAYASVIDNRTGDPVCVTPSSPQSQPVWIATAAHSVGAAGTNWRTDLELRNPYASQAAYRIELLKRDTSNGTPLSQTFTLDPGKAVRYADVVDAVFHFSGAAALRVVPTSGSLQASSRTYNLMLAGNPLGLPQGATFGQFVPGYPDAGAIPTSDAARLIMLGQDAGYRTNIGVVNATAAQLAVRIDLYRADATLLGTIQGTSSTTLPPYGYVQIDKVFQKVTASEVADGFAVVRPTTTGGSLFAYASVIDNRTGDPIFVTPVRPVSAPPPTPTPTPTPPLMTASEAARTLAVAVSDIGTTAASYDTLVATALTSGLGTLASAAAACDPAHVSTIPGGLHLDYGSGVPTTSGVVKGTADVNYSGVVISGSTISCGWSMNPKGFAVDGELLPVGLTSGTFTATQRSSGTTTATVTLAGADPTNPAVTAATGSAVFDTAVCKNYPISGSVAVTLGGQTSTVTFNQRCDGSFGYTGPALKYIDYQPYWNSATCDGWNETSVYRFMSEGGRLSYDNACPASRSERLTFSGSVSASAMRIDTVERNNEGRPWIETSMTATVNPANPAAYQGTMAWKVTAYNWDGSVRCTDNGTEEWLEFVVPTSWCESWYASAPQR